MLQRMRDEADRGVMHFSYPGVFLTLTNEPAAFYSEAPVDGYEVISGRPEEPPHRAERRETTVFPVHMNGIYDLGREDIGYVRVRCKHRPNVYVGESVAEVMNSDYSKFEQLPMMIPDGRGVWRSAVPLAARYVRTDMPGGVESLTFSSQVDWTPASGSFTCDDPRKTKIWQVSVETLRPCHRTFIVDAIKRDRLPWAGDLAVVFEAEAYTFGDAEILKRTLSALGSAEVSRGPVCGIGSYSLWWVICHDILQRHFAERRYLQLHYPRIRDRVNELATHEDGRGYYAKNLAWDFLDWTDSKGGELKSEMTRQVVYFASLKAAVRLADRVGDRDSSVAWNAKAERLRVQILKDGMDGTRHARALAIVYDLVTGEMARQYAREIAADNLPPTVTPYMSAFEVWALAKGGEKDAAVRKFESVWGAMVDAGATTYWEGWDGSKTGDERYEYYGRPFANSLCHSWSAGPGFLLPGVFCGIRPTSDGWATSERKPLVPEYALNARCVIPAAKGRKGGLSPLILFTQLSGLRFGGD